jgi:hypothetical protein
MPEGEMIEFAQVLSELQMSEQDLQNLIARGELRAFRAGGTMKFRQADVDLLKKERATEPTIIIPAVGSQQMNVDVPQDLGVDESAATVVPETMPGGAAPTVDLGGPQSGTEEIVFEDSDLEILPLETDASAATAEVTVASEEPVIVDSEPTVIDEESAASSRSSRRDQAAPMGSRRTMASHAKEPGDPVWTIGLVLTSLVFLFVGGVFAIMLWKGYYDDGMKQKYVPAFLKDMQESAKTWGDQPQ